MEPEFVSMGTAEAWQMSNAPVFNMAIHAISLNQFLSSDMRKLREKSLRLTAYLEKGIHAVKAENELALEIITPSDPERRGCQLSLVAHGFGKQLFNQLTEGGVVVDWREPNVIRMAPVPMYNTFEDIARFVGILNEATNQAN
jgi:kynureninase